MVLKSLSRALPYSAVVPHLVLPMRVFKSVGVCTMSGTDVAYGATRGDNKMFAWFLVGSAPLPNQRQENTISVQFVLGMRFLVLDFAVYWPMRMLCDARY